MRRLQLALVIALVAALLLPALAFPVRADTWFTDDFTTGEHGWQYVTCSGAPLASYSAGVGWVHTDVRCPPSNGSYVRRAFIFLQFAEPYPTIDEVQITYDGTYGNRMTCEAWNTTLQNCSAGTNQTFTWTGSKTQSVLYAEVDSSVTPTAAYSGAVTIKSVAYHVVTGGPTLTPTNTPTLTLTPANTPIPTQPPSGTCQSGWTKTYDFTQGAGGWQNRPSHDGEGVQDDSGYHTVPYAEESYTGYSEHLVIQRSIGYATSETVIDNISLDVTYSQGDAGSPDLRKIQVLNGSTALVDDAHPPVSGHKTLTWTGFSNGGTFYIEVYASGALQGGANNGSATVNSITLIGAGYNPDGQCESTAPSSETSNWAYPIATGEQSGTESVVPLSLILSPVVPIAGFSDIPFTFQREGIGGTYDQREAQGGVALFGHPTSASNVNIHSMTDGTVSEVRTISSESGLCLGVDVLRQWPAYTCQGFIGASERFFDYGSAYLVKIQTSTAYLYYLVAEVTVQQGQNVSKGCILGKGLAFFIRTVQGAVPLGGTGQTERSSDVYTMVWARDLSGNPFDLIPYLREEPQDITCGGGSGGGGGCTYVKDASFSLAGDSAWRLSGGAPEHAPGQEMGLWLKSETYQSLGLVSSATYGITVQAHLRESGSGLKFRALPDFDALPSQRVDQGSVYSFSLTVGGNPAETITISSITGQTVNIAPATILPSSSGGFTLTLSPTEATRQNIVVDYVCLTDSDSGPAAPAGDCLFLNPEFDTAGDWTLTDGGNGIPIIDNGIVYIPHASSIAQSVHLYPKSSGAQNYTLTMEASRQGVPSTGKSVSFDWSYSSHSGTIGPFSDNVYRSGTDDFSITTETTATFTISTDGGANTDQVGIVDRVCITTTDGVDPPGYQRPEAPGISPSCKVCAYSPVGDINYDLAGVIGWLMCGISQIWHCQMKTILYGIWQVATSILAFLALFRLWISYTLISVGSWGNTNVQILARWLNGQFVNLGQMLFSGPRAVITTDTGSNLWDALRTLFNSISSIVSTLGSTLGTFFNDLKEVLVGLIQGIVTLALALFSLVGEIVTLIITGVFSVISQIVELVQMLLNVLIGAINAPPVAVPGVPICDMQADMIPQSCVPIFIIDNTILSDDSPVWTVLPWIEGVSGFAVLWWAIHKIRNALLE